MAERARSSRLLRATWWCLGVVSFPEASRPDLDSQRHEAMAPVPGPRAVSLIGLRRESVRQGAAADASSRGHGWQSPSGRQLSVEVVASGLATVCFAELTA